MIDPQKPLRERIAAAGSAAFGAEAAGQDAAIHRSAHADYQADVALGLARRLKKPPRDVATAIVGALPADDLIARAEVSGPGFINLTIKDAAIDERLRRMLGDSRLGVPLATPETVVIDYSPPTVPKQMPLRHLPITRLRRTRAPARGAATGGRRRHAGAVAAADRPVGPSLHGSLSPPARHAAAGGRGRREYLQRRAAQGRRRAGTEGPGPGQRGSGVRVPARVHRARGPAGAADHPQAGRRLRLRH